MRRAQIKVALNDTRRLFFGSNSFEHTKRYLVDYIYILSRKLDVELGFNGYDFTRKVNDRVLDYNTDGYYLRFGVKYVHEIIDEQEVLPVLVSITNMGTTPIRDWTCKNLRIS